MATDTWRTRLDVLGLATYITIMTGAPPDRELLDAARRQPAARINVGPAKANEAAAPVVS